MRETVSLFVNIVMPFFGSLSGLCVVPFMLGLDILIAARVELFVFDLTVFEDSFHFKEIENMAIGYLEIRAKWVVKGNVDVDIGTNPSAKGGEYDEGVDDQAVKALMLSQLALRLLDKQWILLSSKMHSILFYLFRIVMEGSRRKVVASLYTLV
ncbi:hypothetical protein CASFOL_018498 [Castilleja foliolosa]|uniref:Uncharacterized protein n=1 Tax=Castilleja foliolosa TaxID=1961234 RepID=A0ABD3D7F2_9LAMI